MSNSRSFVRTRDRQEVQGNAVSDAIELLEDFGIKTVKMTHCPHCAFAWVTVHNYHGQHDQFKISMYQAHCRAYTFHLAQTLWRKWNELRGAPIHRMKFDRKPFAIDDARKLMEMMRNA